MDPTVTHPELFLPELIMLNLSTVYYPLTMATLTMKVCISFLSISCVYMMNGNDFINSLIPVTSPSLEVPSLKTQYEPKGNGDTGLTKIQHLQKADGGSSSTIHPVRTIEEENLDYDSNASSSSLIFNSPS
ncbi:hypothetical protein S245_047684 [Arachis hypogaea]